MTYPMPPHPLRDIEGLCVVIWMGLFSGLRGHGQASVVPALSGQKCKNPFLGSKQRLFLCRAEQS